MARPKIARSRRSRQKPPESPPPFAEFARAELSEASGELAAAREAAALAYATTGDRQNQAFCELFALLAQVEASLAYAGFELDFNSPETIMPWVIQ